MLYDVEQVADKLKVSKMTIYNKIKLKDFKDKVIIKAGKRYIDDDLFNLIKDTLKTNIELENNIESKEIEQEQKEEISRQEEDLLNFKEDLIATLKDEIEFLRQEIGEKNKQLESKDKLLENMQVLIKQEQEKKNNGLLLEEHFKELDLKLISIREQMEQRKEHAAEQKKGLLKRLFKK